jgi:hypothetical protein
MGSDYMQEIIEFLEIILDILSETSEITGDVNGISLGTFSTIFTTVMTIFLTVGLIIAVIGFVCWFAYYIFTAIPVYKLAKKLDCKYAWLAWVPIFNEYCRWYVLCSLAGNKPFDFSNGKIKFNERKFAFLTHVLVSFLGYSVISILIVILSFIPFLGQLASLVLSLGYFIPPVICALLEYVFLRDVLNIFKQDKKSNDTTVLIIAIVDCITLTDIASTICLYTLLKLHPLPEHEIIIEPSEPVVEVIDDAPIN